MTKIALFISSLVIGISFLSSCKDDDDSKEAAGKETNTAQAETPEYFNLRPKLEKDYGYSHAVRIGPDIGSFVNGLIKEVNANFLEFDPTPFNEFVYEDHPSTKKRIILISGNNRSL